MSPEVINKKSYDNSVDIWACGLIIYIMCSGGRHPIYTRDMSIEDFNNKMKMEIEWKFPEAFPLLARNLFMKLCKTYLSNRYEVPKALRHPWITRNPSSTIPETLIESYSKMNLLTKFKVVLQCALALHIYKVTYLKHLTKMKTKISSSLVLIESIENDLLNVKEMSKDEINDTERIKDPDQLYKIIFIYSIIFLELWLI